MQYHLMMKIVQKKMFGGKSSTRKNHSKFKENGNPDVIRQRQSQRDNDDDDDDDVTRSNDLCKCIWIPEPQVEV